MQSEFVRTFGCAPDEVVRRMQSLSDAYAEFEPEESICAHCLRPGLIEALLARDYEWPIHVSLQELLAEDRASCHLCDFVRARLKKQITHDVVEDIRTGRHPLYCRFEYSENVANDWRDTVFLFTVPYTEVTARLGMAFLTDDRTDNSLAYPPLLRFSSKRPKGRLAGRRVRNWIQACDQHQSCKRNEKPALPSRVIDVGTWDSPALHLHVSGSQDYADYVTLSYCWGGYDGLKLLASNKQSLEQGIAERRLPRTYKDAVWISRHLGVRYLWIDALCIVQDDDADWEAQSRMMHAVYGNSYLTVCASHASSPTDGFLKHRDLDSFTHAFAGSLSHEGTAYPVYLTDYRPGAVADLHHVVSGALRDQRLTSRAWAVQERLLSRRALYFTKEVMIWQCRQCTEVECGVSAGPQPGLLSILPEPGPVPVGQNLTTQNWHRFIQTYSHCHLSRPEDRLPAIAGYAAQLSLLSRETEYVAGHWTHNIFESLVWRSQPEGHNERHKAPSWSWASARHGVHFSKSTHRHYKPIAKLLGYDGGHFRKGSPTTYLKIRAPVATGQIFCFHMPNKKMNLIDYVHLDTCPQTVIYTRSVLDDIIPFGTHVVLAVLHTRREEPDLRWSCGLVLQGVDGRSDTEFRRIGVFYIDKKTPRQDQALFPWVSACRATTQGIQLCYARTTTCSRISRFMDADDLELEFGVEVVCTAANEASDWVIYRRRLAAILACKTEDSGKERS